MGTRFRKPGVILSVICIGVFLLSIILLDGSGFARPKPLKGSLEKAYKVYNKRCLGCHVSVADPERPGRTRDEWHIVVNVMHNYGIELTTDEGEMIIELLYNLRRGTEKQPG